MDNPAFGGLREPFCRRAAWAWLIENACWQNQRVEVAGRTVNLQRGQLSHSLRFLGKAWGWDNMKVHRFITRLLREKMAEAVSDAGQLVITICNYDTYQASSQSTDAHGDAAPRQHRGSTEANNKEGNEGNEGNVEETSSPAPAGHPNDVADLFQVADVVRFPDQTNAAIEMWNKVAAECGLSLVRSLNTARRSSLRLRLKECGGISGWKEALDQVRASSFLLGDGDRGWKADFDFILQPKSFAKLREGTYANRGSPKTRPGDASWMADPAAYFGVEQGDPGYIDGVAEAVS